LLRDALISDPIDPVAVGLIAPPGLMSLVLRRVPPCHLKRSAPQERGVITDLSPKLPITEAELQIVETYLVAIIQKLTADEELSGASVVEG